MMLAGAVLLLSWFAITPDPAAGPLVERLGARSWREREAATSALQRMGRTAQDALQDALAESEDAEVTSRVRRLLARLWDAGAFWEGPLPWVDGLACRNAWAPYLARAHDGRSIEAPGWPSWRHATSLLVGDWLRWGVPQWWIAATLEGMREREADYRRRHGMAALDAAPTAPLE